MSDKIQEGYQNKITHMMLGWDSFANEGPKPIDSETPPNFQIEIRKGAVITIADNDHSSREFLRGYAAPFFSMDTTGPGYDFSEMKRLMRVKGSISYDIRQKQR